MVVPIPYAYVVQHPSPQLAAAKKTGGHRRGVLPDLGTGGEFALRSGGLRFVAVTRWFPYLTITM